MKLLRPSMTSLLAVFQPHQLCLSPLGLCPRHPGLIQFSLSKPTSPPQDFRSAAAVEPPNLSLLPSIQHPSHWHDRKMTFLKSASKELDSCCWITWLPHELGVEILKDWTSILSSLGNFGDGSVASISQVVLYFLHRVWGYWKDPQDEKEHQDVTSRRKKWSHKCCGQGPCGTGCTTLNLVS